MTCSPRILAVPHAITIFGGIAIIIVGLLITTNKVEDAGCIGQTKGLKDIEDINNYSLGAGAVVSIGGFFALFGGVCGVCGGLHQFQRSYARGGNKRQRCRVCTAAVMVFFSILCHVCSVAAIAAGYGIANNICDKSTAGSNSDISKNLYALDCPTFKGVTQGAEIIPATNPKTYAYSVDPAVCEKAKIYCSADYTKFCDYDSYAVASFVIVCVNFIIMLVTFICAFSAAMCCRAKFEMLPEKVAGDHEAGIGAGGQA